MIAIAYRSLQFLVFHALVLVVDRVSRLPRSGGRPMNLNKWKAAAKDAIWALDFFFVRTASDPVTKP